MSQTRDLLKIDYHTDDDTGTYDVGEIDFGICGSLESYIQHYGNKGVQDILATLGHLAWAVKDTFYKLQDAGQIDCQQECGKVPLELRNENQIGRVPPPPPPPPPPIMFIREGQEVPRPKDF